MELKGVTTALITPFEGNGVDPEIDWDSYRNLLRFQKDNGINFVLPNGTTGESPTITFEEYKKLISIALEEFGNNVIAGAGSNSTAHALELAREAKDLGAVATLQVTPYYNKPSQEGLFRHFSTIAEKVDLPMILYNIPGRTSREILPETISRLHKEHSNIVAVKEATGNPDFWKRTRELCGKNLIILSGDDNKTYTLMKDYGALGVISVASNIIPKRMVKFIDLGLNNDFDSMSRENNALDKLFQTLFIDTNPIPVKQFAFEMRIIKKLGYRLPMCETSKENVQKIRECIMLYSLI
ncbi:MAG: 4-hydroxy-tetrahydrodipicolinate synthase [Candidatus Micrarchaeota archaeon]|nr:4-hydroxy-tetrahydrodipicolinate synthase [Candidatus Micrarchaeota archaeon]